MPDNFKGGHGFDYWKQGYESLLDTTVIKIEEDKDKKDRVKIKLSTKDMVDDENGDFGTLKLKRLKTQVSYGFMSERSLWI